MNSAASDSAPAADHGRAWALARYVFAATLVRSADGGGVVAIVLLAGSLGLPGWVSGLLGASITAPTTTTNELTANPASVLAAIVAVEW